MESVFIGLDQYSEEEKLQRLLKLKLRYFTPREVANLMGFPQSFCKSKSCQYVMSVDRAAVATSCSEKGLSISQQCPQT